MPAWLPSLAHRLYADRRVRYILAGGVSSTVYYGLFTLGWLAAGRWVSYLIISVAVNAVTALVTFPVYRRLVFRAQGPFWPTFLRFYATCLWALAATLFGVAALVELAGWHVLVAQAVVILAVPLVNYQLGRFWVFRRR